VLAHGQDRREDVVEGVRIQGDDLGGAAEKVERVLDVASGQSADPAEVLRQDQVGGQRGQRVGVQRVQVLARGEPRADVGVDGARGHPGGVAPAHHHGLVHPGRRWLVAFERHPGQLSAQAEGVDDLGRRRKQGDNPHDYPV